MTPERNQPNDTQEGQQNTGQSNTETTTEKYRPDWIVPDNGSSSRRNNPSERNNGIQESRQGNSNVPLDNEDTLGIP